MITATTTAVRLTASDRPTIANKVASPDAIRCHAVSVSDMSYFVRFAYISRIFSLEVKFLNIRANMRKNAG
jgi:hypothetical protein